MSSDNQAQVVPCPRCSAKLRIGPSARGKTLNCPKCGQAIKIKDNTAPASRVGAQPIHQAPAEPVQEFAPGDWANDPLAQSYSEPSWNAPQAPLVGGNAYQPKTITREVPVPTNYLWLWITLGGIGGALLLVLMVAGVIALLFSGTPSSDTVVTNSPSDAASAVKNKPKEFPKMGSPMPFGEKIGWHRVEIPREQGSLKLNIFVPNGEHAPGSLPVMFEAPPGTNLLHGADIEFPRLETEILPFTEAGMITVTFSIDGPMPSEMEPTSPLYLLRLGRAYKEFVASDAGVECGKLAIDYVLAQVPQADSKRLYVWGHSSAATLALLLASKDARVSKCVAMAPCTDLNKRLGELQSDRAASKVLPKLPEYFKNGSPITYVNKLTCPVFVAHARDDDNEPFEDTEIYVQELNKAGGKVTFADLNTGGHYEAMLKKAIPQAVQWISR